MGERRDVVVLIAVLFCLAAVALLARPDAERRADDPRISTFRSGPHGARALLLLMDELGIPRGQRLRPWTEDEDPDDVLVMLAPSQAPTQDEVAALVAWVRRGGTLVYGAGRNDDAVLRALDVGALLNLGSAVDGTGRPARAGDPWLAEIDSVPGFRAAFADGARALQGGAVPLLRTAAGPPVVVLFPIGEGRAIVFSSARVLSNAAVREPGAALLFARVAASSVEHGGVVRFDEYHHGFREGGPARALWRFVTHTNPGRGLLQLLVAGLALLLLFGHRFGAPVAERTGRRRSPLEHVEAVAAAYRRAGARATARRLLVAGLERRIGRRLMDEAGAITGGMLSGTPAGRRLGTEWERGELVGLAGAVDDFVAEVRRWK
jgi:hypothetical protein